MIQVDEIDTALAVRLFAAVDSGASATAVRLDSCTYYTISGRKGVATASGDTFNDALRDALDRWERMTVAA
jgi:hypothetical protein